jgi:beta-galactosidase
VNDAVRYEMSEVRRENEPIGVIELSETDLSVLAGHLHLGGRNPQGVEIAANSRYLTLGGEPWYPILGEFHFSRYPKEEWEEELLKMKAGGISVVATYIFWIYHEEAEGQWEWSGNRDLRSFVTLCRKHGLYAYPRIGPWAHGEVRNGGFPDWLLTKCGKSVRTDAEPYLGYALEFYRQIGAQLEGLLWKEGGPVVGTQIENELTNNPAHLLTLKNLALEAGIDVPLYTVTGWMGAQFPEDEVLPVFGGYPDAFWSPQVQGWARESRVHYFFSGIRDDSTIGVDLAEAAGAGAGERMWRYPYGTVELGGGMAISYRRRPVVKADDIAAIALTRIGSGSNMQGYYMYHGGANAIGRFSTLQESQATGYPNDLPVINYDFQAPLGQYGQRRVSYGALRMQHLFLHDFGSSLARLPMRLPVRQPAGMDDRETLRWSVRSDGRSGFLFVNNYQRIEELPDHDQVQFELRLSGETVILPSRPICIPAQRYFTWPFNLELGGALLKYATAQPLCQVGETIVFFAIEGIEPEFVFGQEALKPEFGVLHPIPGAGTRGGKILLLTEGQARQAYKATLWGAERLFLSPAGLVFDGETLRVQSRRAEDLLFSVYPAPPSLDVPGVADGIFTRFTGSAPRKEIAVSWKQVKQEPPLASAGAAAVTSALAPGDLEFERAGEWHVSLPHDALEGVREVFLRVDYEGDAARAYVGDRMIDDDFYFGRAWEIGLKRLAPEVLEKGVRLKVLPLCQEEPLYIPDGRRPKFGAKGSALRVRSVTAEPEYEWTAGLEKG